MELRSTKFIKNSNDFKHDCTIYKDNNVQVEIVYEIKTKKLFVKKTFYCNDNESISYFFNEVQTLENAKIDGFPFLKFYGYNPNEDGESFLLTEYLDNGSLDELIEDRFENIKNADTIKMKIFYGVAFGLNYLHNRKNIIIHRDIKPGNIFLDKSYDPYIGDFGFARVIQEEIKMTGNIGTIFYMAPEIFDKTETEPDVLIDTYSYAITVLQTITYSLSIRINDEIVSISDINDDDLFKQLIQDGERYIEIDDVPADFKQFIIDCWDEDPKKRWPMDKIIKSMREHKLYLKDCNSKEFDDYVKKLDEASIRHRLKEEEEEEEEEGQQEEDTQEFNF